MTRPSSMNTNDTSCVVATILEYKYHVSLVFGAAVGRCSFPESRGQSQSSKKEGNGVG